MVSCKRSEAMKQTFNIAYGNYFRVYAAGPLQGEDLVRAQRWRRRLKSKLLKLGIMLVFPPDMEWFATHNESPCDVDIHEIRSCHALYSNLPRLSAGTIVEMYVAKYDVEIPVVCRCRIPNPSPWIAFVTTTFVNTEREAIKELLKLKGEWECKNAAAIRSK